MTALVLLFKKIEIKDETKYGNFYLSSKIEIIINESDIDYVFESIYSQITSYIKKILGGSSSCVSISKYNPLAGRS